MIPGLKVLILIFNILLLGSDMGKIRDVCEERGQIIALLSEGLSR